MSAHYHHQRPSSGLQAGVLIKPTERAQALVKNISELGVNARPHGPSYPPSHAPGRLPIHPILVMPLTFLASTTPSLWIFYWLIFNALVTVAGAESVGAADSQLSYLGTWVDQDNGGHKFTGEKGASVSLSFKGTCAIAQNNR